MIPIFKLGLEVRIKGVFRWYFNAEGAYIRTMQLALPRPLIPLLPHDKNSPRRSRRRL